MWVHRGPFIQNNGPILNILWKCRKSMCKNQPWNSDTKTYACANHTLSLPKVFVYHTVIHIILRPAGFDLQDFVISLQNPVTSAEMVPSFRLLGICKPASTEPNALITQPQPSAGIEPNLRARN